MYNSNFNIAGSTDPNQKRSDLPHLTGSFGDASAGATSPPPSGDDPQAIELREKPGPSPEAVARAETFLGRLREAAGENRFAAGVAIALLYRSAGRSELDAKVALENWSRDECRPPLEPSPLRDAIYAAYVEPVVAEQIVADALSGAASAAPGALTETQALAKSPADRESTAQQDDGSPPRAIVETTAPSSLTVAALVDTTTLAVTTPPVGATSECALCAARRKAKRERTRRWRVRMRNATQPRGEVANVR